MVMLIALFCYMSIPGKRLIKEDDEAWYVEAGAGENWRNLSNGPYAKAGRAWKT